MADRFEYKLFGLRLRSEWLLPELSACGAQEAPDIVIVRRAIPPGLPHGPMLQMMDDGVLLTIEGVARYWIAEGASIGVDPETGARDENVRLFLLGSAMGILLHQRGLLPLHANAVEVAGRAIAFVGRSGAGKSTLAGWFHDSGHRVIADDVCVVRFNAAGEPFATAGIPRLRLWKDALLASGRSPDDYRLSYAGDENYEKYDVPLGKCEDAPELRLAAIYQLEEGSEFAISALNGVAAAQTLFANTYRGAFVQLTGKPRDHWDACLRLLARTPVFRVSRSWGLLGLPDETASIIAHAQSLDDSQYLCD